MARPACVNDYLDPFFNAAVDTGIVLATSSLRRTGRAWAARPISAIRNHAAQVSDILGLPQHVCRWRRWASARPSFEGVMSPRLGLNVTNSPHDRYDEDALKDKIATYDQRREAVHPYKTQRYTDKFGQSATYGWSRTRRGIFGAGAGRFRRIRVPQGLQARLIVRFFNSSRT